MRVFLHSLGISLLAAACTYTPPVAWDSTTNSSTGGHAGDGTAGSTSSATSSSSTGAGGGGVGGSGSASGGAGGNGGSTWVARRLLVIDLGQTGSVTDFPVLVPLIANRINYNLMRPDGFDIRFTDLQGNLIPHEIERWSPGNRSFVWVRIPLIDQGAASKTSFWMYYGNSTAPDAQDAPSVWSNGFRGVWHLHEKGDALTDSSGTNAPAANYGSTIISNGQIGPARNFDQSLLQWIDTGFKEDLSEFTIEVWAHAVANPSSISGPNGPLMREKNFQICWDHNEPYTGGVSLRTNSNWPNADFTGLTANTWVYLAATHDSSTLRAYTNGSYSASVSAGMPDSEVETVKIGRHAFGTMTKHHFNGSVDEVRISNIVRSSLWISAQHRSMTDSLLSFGTEELGSFNVP